MIGEVLEISRSARALGYEEGRRDAIRIIADGAERSDLDRPTLLWVLGRLNALAEDKNNEQ